MNVVLFTPRARVALLALAAAAIVLAGLIALARRRFGKTGKDSVLGFLDGLVALTAAVAIAAALAVAAEKLIAVAATASSPSGVDFNEWRWVLAAPWGRTGLIVGLACAAVTVVLSWRGTRREKSVARRLLLTGLRASACAAALVVFLEPALELRHVTREPNHVAVIVDDSRSMGLAEVRGGKTRAERAQDLIARSASTFETWRGEHTVDFYSFSDAVVPRGEKELGAKLAPGADATLVREALGNVRARYDSRDLAGIILVSDGTPTDRFADGVEDGGSIDFLHGLDTRVHTVWAGRDGLRDLAVARIDYGDFAYVRTVVKIEAVIRATGLPMRQVPVSLRRGGQLVRQTVVNIGGGISEARVSFELVPERVGKYVYEISVPVDDEEAVSSNNVRAFVLPVIRDKIRVLQVAGRPSYDVHALRAYLKANPNVDLISFFILRTPDDIQIVPADEMSLIPFPTEELFEQELGSFDVVFLQDFDYARYGIGPYLENIRAYVEGGGAMAMLGGELSFSSGGYADTPLSAALPVELMSEYAGELLSFDEFSPVLTEEGLRHPVTQLRFERTDNVARWKGLPPLEGLNLTLGARAGATTLLEHPSLTAGGRAMPVLVVGEYGAGRTLAFMTDSAWRYRLSAAGVEGEDGRAYDKFIENMIRWLIRDPDLDYLHVETDAAEYGPGALPRVRVRLVDKDYRPAANVTVSVNVAPLTEGAAAQVLAEKKLTTDPRGEAFFELEPPPPGAYRVIARAPLGDRAVTAEDVFLVNPERQELEHPAAREDILQGISALTGGRYLGEAAAIDPTLPLAPPRVVRVDRRVDVELWSRPYVFVLALVLLGAEWALRRRRGYL